MASGAALASSPLGYASRDLKTGIETMRTSTRHTLAQVTAAFAAVLVLLCAGVGAPSASAGTLSPLPPSAYTVRAACPAPAPGYAACMAQQLVPETAEARAHTHPLGLASAATAASPSPAAGDFGLRPQDLHSAYQLPDSAPTAQTVALVDAYNDPTAEADLKVYDEEFGLPECTAAGGCFTQVNKQGETGKPSFPKTTQELQGAREGSRAEQEEAEEAEGWGLETSLDIEAAHATCQSCKILLVESSSTSDQNLDQAEQTAAALGANEISNSWGAPECVQLARVRECEEDSPAFNHPGIVITASAGDNGYLGWDSPEKGFAEFPASSPRVVAVGGTHLSLTDERAWAGETVWNDGGESNGVRDGYGAGGGGCSVQFEAQPWQQSLSDWASVGCGQERAVADVAADADPYTGLAVYDSGLVCETSYEQAGVEHVVHWCTLGGTSLASPVIASVFALAGGAHGVAYPARTLYENEVKDPSSLHDVTSGSNGQCHLPFKERSGVSGCTAAEEAEASCSSEAICLAGSGYDGPTGVGTPNGIDAFQPDEAGAHEEPTHLQENAAGGNGPGKESEGAGASAGSSGSGAGGSSSSSPGTATATTSATPLVELSGLALSVKAIIALNTSLPRIPELGFTFTLNRAARVRVSLAKLLSARGHTRWRLLAGSLTIAAASGYNNRHLDGRGVLSAGAYRLTLAPLHGTARSIVFKIG
jgi:hypothetical protein